MLNFHEVAHRGWGGIAPENTQSAFENVLKGSKGHLADGIECDLQLTKDGKLILMHDISLGRTSYGSGLVGDHTYEELLSFDFGASFAPKFTGEQIMLFSELLNYVNGNKFLFLEVKNPGNLYPAMMQKLLQVLNDYPRDRFMVESFNHKIIKNLKEQDSSIQTGLIVHDESNFMIEQCRDARCDWISLLWMLISPSLFRKFQLNELKVGLWTVNQKWEYDWIRQKMKDSSGELWITTDYPGIGI